MVSLGNLRHTNQDQASSRVVADGGESRLNRLLDGLRRPRCRRVLYCLADDEPQTLEEVATAVAELEIGSTPTYEQRAAVEIALYHHVLPRLADLRLVEYDSRSGSVCFRNPPEELEEFLRLCRQLDAED